MSLGFHGENKRPLDEQSFIRSDPRLLRALIGAQFAHPAVFFEVECRPFLRCRPVGSYRNGSSRSATKFVKEIQAVSVGSDNCLATRCVPSRRNGQRRRDDDDDDDVHRTDYKRGSQFVPPSGVVTHSLTQSTGLHTYI